MGMPIILASLEEFKRYCGMKCQYNGYVYDPKGALLHVETIYQNITTSCPAYPNQDSLRYTNGTTFHNSVFFTKITVQDLKGYDFVFDISGNIVCTKEEKDPKRKGQIYIRRNHNPKYSGVHKDPIPIYDDVKIQDLENMLTPEAYSRIFTTIISMLMNNDRKIIRNGEVSIVMHSTGIKPQLGRDTYNILNGSEFSKHSTVAYFNTNKVAAILLRNDKERMERFSTIWNVLNVLGARELIGHGVLKNLNDDYATHYLVYAYQMGHETWDYTTGEHKKSVIDNFYRYYNNSQEDEKKYSDREIHGILKKDTLYPRYPQQGRADSLFLRNTLIPIVRDTTKMKQKGEKLDSLKIFPKNRR